MCRRNVILDELEADGSHLVIIVGIAVDSTNNTLWHPATFNDEIISNVGLIPAMIGSGSAVPRLARNWMLAGWEEMCDYQAKALNYCATEGGFDVIYSHIHNVDAMGHKFWHHAKPRANTPEAIARAEEYQDIILEVYRQTDRYLGQFLHLLDEGWTIMIFSDHAQVASKHDLPLLVDINGICTPVMEELGYTVLKRDENGNRIGEIDWTKTRAVMQRDGHIYLNIKGRNKHGDIDGLVDPADQYELEEQIMTDLYGYKDPKTGHRVVSVALRNKDAVLLGQGGPEAGDICVWIAEGYNFDHADSLSTTYGESDTSVSPIFIAAGQGLQKGVETDRMIRQVDFAATVAALAGVRMPAQCEGAPVYQIFEEEF